MEKGHDGHALNDPITFWENIMKRLGKKEGKEKTPHLGIKQLEKIRPHAVAKPSQGR